MRQHVLLISSERGAKGSPSHSTPSSGSAGYFRSGKSNLDYRESDTKVTGYFIQGAKMRANKPAFYGYPQAIAERLNRRLAL